MINVIITAGGTIEDIDEVRKITNTSTGQLGVHICNETVQYLNRIKEAFHIYYVMSKTAVKPDRNQEEMKHISFHEITDTMSLKNKVESLIKENKINYFIHCMAVSDFTTDHIVPIDLIAQEIYDKIKTGEPQNDWKSLIVEALRNPDCVLDKEKKISSKSDLLITLKRTPKIISLIKQLDSEIFLVGFKLLKDVDESALIDASNILINQNGCDLVLANDLKQINQDNHLGLLIEKGIIIGRYNGKEEIAKAIISEMFKRRMEK